MYTCHRFLEHPIVQNTAGFGFIILTTFEKNSLSKEFETACPFRLGIHATIGLEKIKKNTNQVTLKMIKMIEKEQMLKKRTTKHNKLTYKMIEKEQEIRKD